MKRLKKYFLDLDIKDTTYNSIYLGAYGYTQDGQIIYNNPTMSGVTFDSTYWYNEISYSIERTHKLTPDKPSIRIKVPLSKLRIENKSNKTIIADYCLRNFGLYIDELNSELYNRTRPDKENGAFYIHKPTSIVLERNSCYITNDNDTDYFVNIMIMVQLPLKNHKKSARMLCNSLPNAVQNFINNFNTQKLDEAIELYQTQICIRDWLKDSNYCSFVANGSILPRAKGSELPKDDSVPFISPEVDEINVLGIKGMGIKKGVTIITGGGYSGKSTLLSAISLGVYNHISGDGRELVITDDSAIQVSTEEGRSVNNVNISPFIKWIPDGNAEHFSTSHASGSTSQAANIMEAINIGSKLLLIDEDKSAANFMIQDKIMKILIKKEPITPFTVRVNQIFKDVGVSTILVIGSSSEYLSVADNVILMNEYIALNATTEAKEMCKNNTVIDVIKDANWYFKHHEVYSEGFTPYPNGGNTERLEVSDMGFILIGSEKIVIRMLHNIISFQQLNTIGYMLRNIELASRDQHEVNLLEKVVQLYERIEKEGLESIFSTFFLSDRWLELPRKYELFAVINRMRNIRFCSEHSRSTTLLGMGKGVNDFTYRRNL
jgi:hypothetical protein